ncbi:hypothetical protein AMTR_s00041p00206290 [Amborella trichopoda]|uniref:Uncharacterized protein n=1 Tax=Amborella trichopoda TaxID=13333 RepID=W1PYN9_AMBTC|nr:hypothetical protein AMTR_s00041p00206290 [Amborella trichopoda]
MILFCIYTFTVREACCPLRNIGGLCYIIASHIYVQKAYPTVSCQGDIRITPALLVRPRVGLIPTTVLALDGVMMEPSVSVPKVTVARFVAALIADPVLDLDGLADRT